MTSALGTARQPRGPGAEPIPGYRLLEPLGRGGFGEVWKCEAPGGLFKAIKFVDGHGDHLDGDTTAADDESQAIEHIKAIRHPFLLSMERVERLAGGLVIVMELADTNLEHVLRERQGAGRPGVPRDELLGYLAEAAEVLDLLNTQHGLQHLDVKPKNLFVVSGHVKVADFGLVTSLGRYQMGGASGMSLGAVTPIYAAPEVCQGGLSPQSDQYSLAIVYHELLTGALPFDGKSARQLMMQHTTATPDLHRLPAGDLVLVARALSKDPAERHPSCRALVEGLAKASKSAISLPRPVPPPAPAPAQVPPPPRSKTGDSLPPPRPPTGSDLLPGHRFVKCLERGPLTETWQAEGADRQARLVKFVYGFDQKNVASQREAVARLKSLTHPALVPAEVRDGPGRLALVTELPRLTLRERLQECRAEGQAGLPRDEALGYLWAAAGALDDLYQEFGLAHLALNPRPLWLDDGTVLLADYGLVPLFWFPAGRSVVQINPRYAAPELTGRDTRPFADQFALAVIYHEMMAGGLPQKTTERGRFGLGRYAGAYAFEGVTAAEADILARALHDDPAKRFANCREFVETLAGA